MRRLRESPTEPLGPMEWIVLLLMLGIGVQLVVETLRPLMGWIIVLTAIGIGLWVWVRRSDRYW